MNQCRAHITRLDGGIILAVNSLSNALGPLLKAEEDLILGAEPARLREVLAGRTTSREALGKIGVSAVPILSDRNGAPVWPAGICGSISHSHTHVAVAVARQPDFQSVGIDIEDGRSLGIASSSVASDQEITRVVTMGIASDREVAARTLFAVKEAIFKCQAPMTGLQTLGFLDVSVEPNSFCSLAARLVDQNAPRPYAVIDKITIFLVNFQGLTLALATV